ncbi:MAG: ion transporter [Cyclobacteriaceae bacterium]|nr:ion transporter [Cyclobacteriaceae bacterium]
MGTSKKIGRFDLFGLIIFVLSVYVLGALLIDTLFNLDPEVSIVLGIFDDLICVIFLIDFGIGFYRAERKWEFMRWGWIDLISSIPAVEFLRAGRIFSIIRLIRILRVFRSIRVLVKHFKRNRVESAVSSMAIITILLMIFCSISILRFEDVPEGNINTAEDAIWWAIGTITTIGYGDLYPVTTGGRIIASVLIVFGVAMFGTLSGLITSWFIGSKKKRKRRPVNS